MKEVKFVSGRDCLVLFIAVPCVYNIWFFSLIRMLVCTCFWRKDVGEMVCRCKIAWRKKLTKSPISFFLHQTCCYSFLKEYVSFPKVRVIFLCRWIAAIFHRESIGPGCWQLSFYLSVHVWYFHREVYFWFLYLICQDQNCCFWGAFLTVTVLSHVKLSLIKHFLLKLACSIHIWLHDR